MKSVIQLILNSGGQVFVPLIVGGFITGIPLAILTYFVSRRIFANRQLQTP